MSTLDRLTAQSGASVQAEAAGNPAPSPACRLCAAPLTRTVVDLGMSPLCESFLRANQLEAVEPFYPLHVRICDGCQLVQLPAYVAPEAIFTEYAYYSSFSGSFVQHARDYVDAVTERFALAEESLVVEVASNDGYLLQHFVEKEIPVLGVEPAGNVAAAAWERGVPTIVAFFGTAAAERLLREAGRADLIVANNVLSQAPHLNDFVAGLKMLLGPAGVLTVEFPHLMRLLEDDLFDTIYHEHYSYFSLATATRAFAAHGLTRVRPGGDLHPRRLAAPLPAPRRERDARGHRCRRRLSCARAGRRTRHARAVRSLHGADPRDEAGAARAPDPGAPRRPARRCLRRAGEGEHAAQLLRDPHRSPRLHRRPEPVQARPLHARHAHPDPRHPSKLAETRPDVIWILPWNLRAEIADQLAYTREWGARLLVALPRLELLP